ncbi:MAG: universal stress protein [Pirellula sp.]|nr:universal stress protein [Pirellula sp.]
MAWQIKGKILVPFDFSAHSHVAIDKAIEIAGNASGVHVLHVLAPFVPLAPEGVPVEWVDETIRMQHAVEMLRKELSEKRYDGVSHEILVGDAGTVVVDRAESLPAELIVVPSHGRSGLTRLLLGSVAERILRLAKCPVLVLKL